MSAEGAKIEGVGYGLGGVKRFWGGSNVSIVDLLIAHFDGVSSAKYCFSLQFLNF